MLITISSGLAVEERGLGAKSRLSFHAL
jgi:hypothetical protein